MKKKTSLLLFLLFFLMLPVSAAASHTGKETVPTPDEQLEARPENCSMGFNIPDRHGDKVVDTLQNNPQFDWPWKYINDEVHRLYGYYTSMGCDDVICRDPAHTHWCPKDICQDRSHGHSDEEYAMAANYNPTCTCHKR